MLAEEYTVVRTASVMLRRQRVVVCHIGFGVSSFHAAASAAYYDVQPESLQRTQHFNATTDIGCRAWFLKRGVNVQGGVQSLIYDKNTGEQQDT